MGVVALIAIGMLWFILWAQRVGQPAQQLVLPPTPTRRDIEQWIENKRRSILTEADLRTVRVFESPGYIDSTLHHAVVALRGAIPVLEAQWNFEHSMQCALVKSEPAIALARAMAADPHERRRSAQEAVDNLNADIAALRTTAAPSVAEVETVRGPLAFKAHEPTRLADITTQPLVVERLSVLVSALRPPQPLPDRHLLLTGPAGLGKTLIAKVIAHELRRYNAAESQPLPRWIELCGSDLVSVEDFDTVFREVASSDRPVVMLIDEIHCLDERMATKLYRFLEDCTYAFHGHVYATPIPPVMVIGTTTDYGDLHPALKRRLGEPLAMRTRDENR
jgi:ATPase family associated with various cellular activities (AAA)